MRLEPLIHVSNLAQSIEYYTQILGFKLGKLYPNEKNPTYAPIFIGDNKLMLVKAREMNKKFYPDGLGGSGVQFFVKVENIDKIWNKIKDKVTIVDEIKDKPWGDREFTIKDTDGYLISFYTPLQDK